MGFVLGRIRSTKRCVFPCDEEAAGGDEGYLVCAAVAVWIVSDVYVVLQNAL